MRFLKYCCLLLFILLLQNSRGWCKTVKAGPEIDPSTWRGVNLPLQIRWATRNSLSQADFDYAAAAGANVIRLSVHADPDGKNYTAFTDTNSKVLPGNNPGLADLELAVKMAQKAHLKVIIDMHTVPGTKGAKIWQDAEYWDDLTQIWVLIAKKFKDNETVVAFDLMNEPNVIGYIRSQNFVQKASDEGKMLLGMWSPPDAWRNTPRDYNMQMAKMIGAIRDEDDDRYVIVEGFGLLGNPVNFTWMKPIAGFNKVIYSFHMYMPTDLTMLGTKGSIKKGNSDDVKPFNLQQDEAVLDKAFAPVLAFQKKYHVPIFVGEFGITTNAVFDNDASGKPYNGACWLSAVIQKMDKYGWGWTYWDFWTKIRKPESTTDPRYIILSAAMQGKPVPDYCK